MYDPRDMLLFAKVAELGSMSAAARALFKPKASVSRAIARLESKLDTPLLERSSRRIVLTQVGRLFLAHCQRIADEIGEAEAAVGELQGAVRGLLRVASPVVFGRSMLGPILPAFLDSHPELRMELELTNRMIDPLEEGFDLIIRTNSLTDNSLVVRELGVSPYATYASPDYLKRRGPVLVPADLKRHLVIDAFNGAEHHAWKFERAGETVSIDVRPRLDINDAMMRRDTAVAGMGITLMPNWIGNSELGAGRLLRVLPDWTPTRVAQLTALWPARRKPSPRLRAFLAFLSETVPKSLAGDTGSAQKKRRPASRP